jgi:hypothetical protein
MNNEQTIELLKRYASFSIERLASRDEGLQPINDLVQKNLDTVVNDNEFISDESAKQLTKWQQQDVIGTPFSDDMVRACHDIGVKVLGVASDMKSNNEHLCLVAAYLYPLFSQDSRTVDIGWDLQEYMDWYFNGTTHDERKKYTKELIDGWKLSELKG